MRLLVTGGCGFIGTNFIRYLRANRPDCSIVNYDCLTYAGNPENLAGIAGGEGYRFVRGAVEDREKVRETLRQYPCDAVVNFAAESHVDRSLYDAARFVQTNVVGTQTLLDAAREFSVGRFLQVSTDEVYGSLSSEGYFTESTPLCPSSPYSASKAAADLVVQACARTFGLPVVITRSSNNYGPYQFPEKVIPLFISNASEDRPLPLYGDGSNVRDWIYVEDNCRGLLAALERGKPGEVYNIGGGNEIANRDLTKTILQLMGKPESLITFVKDRPAHDLRYALDCAKARRELGWAPKVPFDEGLRRTVEWYRGNRSWLDRVRSGEYKSFYEMHYGRTETR